jgi:hypothetical protein
MSLSFTIAAGLRQRIHSRVRVPWYFRPYFTVSDSRLPFLSPPTTRRATVELFDPASTLKSQSQSQSYVTTDGQSATLFWFQAPIWGLRPDFYTVWLLWVCWCGVLYLTRERVCRLQLLLVFASAVILGSQSRVTRDHIFLSQITDSTNMEDQVAVFISSTKRVAQFYPRHWFPFSSLINSWPLWSSVQSSWLQIQRSRVRFPEVPDFLRNGGSGTGSTHSREYNWGATWMEK